MITKESIKLVEATIYIDKNNDLSLVEGKLPLPKRFRKVVEFGDKYIDIQTGREIKSINSNNIKLMTPYYKNVYELQYITEEDWYNGILAVNNYIDSTSIIKFEEQKDKIRKRKRTRK